MTVQVPQNPKTVSDTANCKSQQHQLMYMCAWGIKKINRYPMNFDTDYIGRLGLGIYIGLYRTIAYALLEDICI